jgi:hypothetical protein
LKKNNSPKNNSILTKNKFKLFFFHSATGKNERKENRLNHVHIKISSIHAQSHMKNDDICVESDGGGMCGEGEEDT